MRTTAASEMGSCWREGEVMGHTHQISVMKLALGHGQKTSAPNSVIHDR